jgi:hypothetical protein
MIKGRLWRFLMILFTIYVIFLLNFLRSFNSDTTETTSPLPHANVKIIESKDEPVKVPEPIVVKNVEHSVADLEPVMTNGTLGNYERKNSVKSSGPGEDGNGVQLQGEEEKKRGDQSVAEYGFNEVASDKISLDRRARDTRYERKIKLTEQIFPYLDRMNVNIGIIQVQINYQPRR